MALGELLLGRPLRTEEEREEQIGPASGVPLLGLDALASAAYGPEAALTVLIAAGTLATVYIAPITIIILLILCALFLSYRQTIAAYPDGGGSYTVAKVNLGMRSGLLAASALSTDYILNVAVAISAGVGAIVSAIPKLLPHTLALCLAILVLLTIINLRGVKQAGLAFRVPTLAFVLCLGGAIVLGLIKTFVAGGHPTAVIPPAPAAAGAAVGTWLLLRAFASGCTAMTGVEAVSNAVPLFRQPRVQLARRTLLIIVVTLSALLLGVAWLSRVYHIVATPPAAAGYQSVLSQMVGAVAGRGAFYYVTMAAVLTVLALSANTSFADFPRVWRLLALDGFLPPDFAHRGRRLVYTEGIVVLTVCSAILLVAFRGVTDRLIPLFAVGAFLAFTMSQLGMVMHWKRRPRERGARRALWVNAAGALATAAALVIIVLSKFTEGAWLTVLVVPAFFGFFLAVRRYEESVEHELSESGELELKDLPQCIVVVPLKRLSRVARKALRFAITMSNDVYAVQVLAEELETEDLKRTWQAEVEEPVLKCNCTPPKLVVIRSPYREFIGPFVSWVQRLAAKHRDRQIAVIIPELAHRRWYHFLLSRRATLLKSLLIVEGGPQIIIVNTLWYPPKEVRSSKR